MNWKRRIVGLLSVAVTVVAVSLLALVVDDARYPEYEFREGEHLDEIRQGLLLTFEASASEPFWVAYEERLAPAFEELRQTGEALLVLSFEHDVRRHPDSPGQWTHVAFVVFRDGVAAEDVASTLLPLATGGRLSESWRSIDALQLQPGLDLFFPVRRGHQREAALVQTLEYVFSEPAARPEYYRDQYLFSGPAMRDLHQRDKAGRFIGFEVADRLAAVEGMPSWDVVHIVGFTRWQTLKAVPFFLNTWNRHARRAYGPGATMRSRLDHWDSIRLNLKTPAKQRFP